MSDLYGDDIVLWCARQADALRRRAANALDWDNLAEEIEGVAANQKREVVSLTAARDQAEKRAEEAQQRADRAEARTDELGEKLDKLLHDQKAAEAVAVEALMKSEEQRRAEIARQARGRLRRAWDGWRGR